ncbi:Protein of unknown function [Lactobacillus acidophilus DSM 9126]
MTEKN